MILLLFDAYKLDISDEFKRAIEALRVRRCLLYFGRGVTT